MNVTEENLPFSDRLYSFDGDWVELFDFQRQGNLNPQRNNHFVNSTEVTVIFLVILIYFFPLYMVNLFSATSESNYFFCIIRAELIFLKKKTPHTPESEMVALSLRTYRLDSQ